MEPLQSRSQLESTTTFTSSSLIIIIIFLVVARSALEARHMKQTNVVSIYVN